MIVGTPLMKSRIVVLLLSSVGLALAQGPTIGDGSIVNGASFQRGQAITGGSLVSIFGTNLASHIAAADTVPLSDTLGGVTVEFINGSHITKAPLLYVQQDMNGQQSQLNVQVPWAVVPNGVTTTVQVVVTNNGVASPPSPIMAGPFSPGIFSSGGRALATFNSDGLYAWPTGSVPGLVTRPAKAGDILAIYATGLGALDVPAADGHNSLGLLRHTLVTPIVLVGGVQAEVKFSGLTRQYVGLNQVDIVVPDVPAGDSVPLQIMVGGITSPANATIAITQ
jgi:uncharacterized protein (TIGR03437 family)